MSSESKPNPREAISSAVSELSAQLAAGNSAALTAYLSAVANFHSYSFGNILLIASQRPTASRVAGFHTWRTKFGRTVKKGEKAIRILAPLVAGVSDEKTGEKAARVFGFRSVCVFDVSQTEGAPLPEFAGASGDAGDSISQLVAFAESNGITVSFEALSGGALGLSYGGRIAIQEGQSEPETVSVLVHELAHELLHKGSARTSLNASRRELEAEAVAYVVGSSIGLNMSTASADYIKLYNGDAAMLAESLEAITKASTLILNALQASEESEVAE